DPQADPVPPSPGTAAEPEPPDNLTLALGSKDEPGTVALPPFVAPAPPPRDALAAGTALGDRYLIQERVGEGGMGVVLRVFDQRLRRELALKLMKPGADQVAERRFLEEAEVCGRLQHPGIVPLHEVDRLSDGRPFFTMKLIRGRTLAEQLCEACPAGGGRVPQVSLPPCLKTFEQVCHAVAYAHSEGVIHRDLKPANVMVGAFGEMQLMDWGLAKTLSGEPRPSDTERPSAGDTSQTSDAE